MRGKTLTPTFQVRDTSWIHEKLFVGPSNIHGRGVHTSSDLPKHTIIIVWGGVLLTTDDVAAGIGVPHTLVAVAEGLWLSAPSSDEMSIDDFVNHSCDPNIGMLDETALITIRDVAAGEELTADYCIWLDNDQYEMKHNCRCGAGICRSKIKGTDWASPAVQERLLPYMSPFLKKRLTPK